MRKLLALIILFTFSGCVGSLAHKTIRYNHIQKTIKENNAALLELKAGMSQSEVLKIIGEPERNEGYPWGTVWIYRTAMSNIYGTTDSDFTPVMFDQDDILLGWGQNYFAEILRNEGSKVSDSNAIQSQEPISSAEWHTPSNWDRIKKGMSEKQVISILGRPTSTENSPGGVFRTLFYRGEVTGSGFVSGNMQLSDDRVWEVNKPVFDF